jgi:hypothetical protein
MRNSYLSGPKDGSTAHHHVQYYSASQPSSVAREGNRMVLPSSGRPQSYVRNRVRLALKPLPILTFVIWWMGGGRIYGGESLSLVLSSTFRYPILTDDRFLSSFRPSPPAFPPSLQFELSLAICSFLPPPLSKFHSRSLFCLPF